MIVRRPASERGRADYGWLKTAHTFSFGSYQDPRHVRFRSLRVINEDQVAAGQGFGTHAHDNMEIVSYVLEGSLEHKDSLGNGEVLRPGEFQRITAGTGISHSEFNPSSDEPVHFYQIWLYPNQQELTPSYEQKRFDDGGMDNRWRVVASPDADEGSLTIHQDAKIYLTRLDAGREVVHSIAPGRHAWLQVMRGEVIAGETVLSTGDGAAVSDESELRLVASSPAEVMLFDLA